MIAQSGSYFLGSVIARLVMPRYGADNIVPFGIGFILVGGMFLCVLSFTVPPSYLTVMGPVALYALGIAFVMPAMTTAALHPFPAIAGAASALMGFIQMGSGFLGGAVAALLPDPLIAIGLVVPGLAIIATAGYVSHRTMGVRTPKSAETRGKLLP
jgi:DHA1 family bicyclomycin/chloramphenicol resistance-like MFS transporter